MFIVDFRPHFVAQLWIRETATISQQLTLKLWDTTFVIHFLIIVIQTGQKQVVNRVVCERE
jgi:uncharacterized integral membrane protein